MKALLKIARTTACAGTGQVVHGVHSRYYIVRHKDRVNCPVCPAQRTIVVTMFGPTIMPRHTTRRAI